MTINRNSTRYYSQRQEKRVAKLIGGKTVANSGAPTFVAGDVRNDNWLIECKTLTEPKKSHTIKKEWLVKNAEEAFAMNKPYNALAFDFGDGDNYFIVDAKTFRKMIDIFNDV